MQECAGTDHWECWECNIWQTGLDKRCVILMTAIQMACLRNAGNDQRLTQWIVGESQHG